MGILSRLFGRKRKTVHRSRMQRQDRGNSEPITIRSRWDSARTNRLNQEHWRWAQGNPINRDLLDDLPTLRARCAYEASTNPMVEGVVNTYATDVVGRLGPTLQVESDDDRFNNEVESVVREIMERPDPDVQLQLPEMIRMWVRSLCTAGDYVAQEITTERPGLPVSIGIRCVESCRLDTPPELATSDNVVFGVETNKSGRPVRYWVRERETATGYYVNYKYTPIPPDLLHLNFQMIEPGQVRGVPWLASMLDVAADLRQYDGHVMEAAKSAAANALVWYSNHPDVEFDYSEVPTEQTIERGQQTYATPGWTPHTVDATQPATQYVDFRKERMREFGRPFNMPLMMVLLSSADSNFSAAHYDGAIYIRGVQYTQSWIERVTLNMYVKKIIREMMLARVFSAIPQHNLVWTWPVPPYVNPKQHYDALRAQLEDGVASPQDVCAAYSRSWETVVAQRARAQQDLAEARLPSLPTNSGRGSGQQDQEQDQQNDQRVGAFSE